RPLPGELRIQVPPLPPRFARLAQMGYERWSYKPEVPESQAGLGTKFGRVVITGALRSCKPEVGIRLPPRPPALGGHGSVAESDIASVGARVRFPLTAPGFAAVAQWQSRSLPNSRRPVRFRPAAPGFRDVG